MQVYMCHARRSCRALRQLPSCLLPALLLAIVTAGCTGTLDQDVPPNTQTLPDVGVASAALTLACELGPENTNEACSDGISNDGDGYIDCNDFDCCGGGLSVCNCCGNGCGPIYPDACTCAVACHDSGDCGAGEYCWAAGDCAASCQPIPAPGAAGPMKVMEYNVLGVTPMDPSPGWIASIVAADADVAVLIETDWDDVESGTTTWCTYYFDAINAAMQAAGKAPYTDYHCARGISFYTLGAALLSRHAILNATHVGEGHPAPGYQDDSGSVVACDDATTDPFMDWVLQAPGGTPVHVISAHLKCCPGSSEEGRREKSQECINNYIDGLGAAAPVIYTGDLNSFSPDDGDPSCFGQSGLGVGPLQILYSSTDSRRTFNHSWTDAYRNWHPLQCGTPSSYGITYPSYASRIDFIEVNQQLAGVLGAASVGAGGGSDHQPLSVVIDMTGGGANCSSDPECDDGLFCNGTETCNAVSGTCQAGTPVSCDDSVGCTVDSCNEATDTCDHAAVDGLCDNGLFCDGTETCHAILDCQPGSEPCPGQSCNEATATCFTPQSGAAWINELHYDNSGRDQGEFVEVAGPAGLDLSGWQLIGYNGNGGSSYKTVNLSGIIATQNGCMGTLDFAFSGLQNGAPDGLALINDLGRVVELISYEGAFTASGGPAASMTTTDIGVAESSSTPPGYSLQRVGSGSLPNDFTWQAPTTASPGTPNAGQSLSGCGG